MSAVLPSASYSITVRLSITNRPGMLGRVAMAIGEGKKVCTWTRPKLIFYSHSARLSMSSSVQPGWAAMK